MSHRPTRRRRQRVQIAPHAWPTAAGAGAAFWFAVHENLVWPQLVGCALAAMLLTSLAGVVAPIRFGVDIDAPPRARVGEPFELAVRIRNKGVTGRRSVVVRQRWKSRPPLVPEFSGFADRVPRGASRTFTATVTPSGRGTSEFAEVTLEIAGAFGFFFRTWRCQLRQPLVSLPADVAPWTPESMTGVLVGDGSAVAAGGVRDVDMRGVRDWRAGDQISDVHWRSVARTGRLAVIERETRPPETLTVVVLPPAKRSKAVRDAAFEKALAVASATAVSAFRRGVATCIVASSADVGVHHPVSEADALDCFARIGAGQELHPAWLAHAVGHAERGGAVLLAASPSTPPEWVQQLASAAASVGAAVVDLRPASGPRRHAAAAGAELPVAVPASPPQVPQLAPPPATYAPYAPQETSAFAQPQYAQPHSAQPGSTVVPGRPMRTS